MAVNDQGFDEGLDEIRDKHTERVFLRTYNKERWFFEKAQWDDMKQAIKELVCKQRAHQTVSVDLPVGSGERCLHCDYLVEKYPDNEGNMWEGE